LSFIYGVIGSGSNVDMDKLLTVMRDRCINGILQKYAVYGGFIASLNNQQEPSQYQLNNSELPFVWDGYFHLYTKENIKSSVDTAIQKLVLAEDKLFSKLTGSYAIAYWNPNTHKLYLIRDPAGSRPIYYAYINSCFVFASSPKAIIHSNLVSADLNPEGISHYFSMIGLPDPVTIYRNIHSLRSGHYLVFSNGEVEVKKYWTAPWISKSANPKTPEELANNLRSALEQSILDSIPEKSNRAGFFLSGGTDTTAVVGIASTAGIRPIHTYTIGYEGMGEGYSEYNEFYYAKLVADRFGTHHHEYTITPNDILNFLPNILTHLDQPSGDAINSYLVANILPEEHDYALSGTGGDEIFIGSHWYLHQMKLMNILRYWKIMPYFLRSIITKSTESLPFQRIRRIFNTLNTINMGVSAQYKHIKFLYDSIEKHDLFTEKLQPDNELLLQSDSIVDLYNEAIDTDPINQMATLLIQNEVTNVQLRDLDLMCHANNLEARSPLMDRRVLDVLAQAPGQMKAPNGQLRSLMFKALNDIIPQETIQRKKMSFIVPMDLWIKRELKPIVDLALSPESIKKRGIFNHNAVNKVYSDFYYAKTEPHSFKLWLLVLFELWCRIHCDHGYCSSPPEKIEDLF